MIVDDEQVRARMAALDAKLTESGKLRSPRWREALYAVHRHVFVPRFWRDEDPGSDPPRWRMIDNATADHDEWFDAVYSDRSLPTELLAVPRHDGRGVHPLVTSSTTMPSLVIAMLEALGLDGPGGTVGTGDPVGAADVGGVMTVLEIGTATGYNAALLSHALGAENVTTVEVSPELAVLARVRLAEHGYHPHVVVGDGAAGVPGRAPFDRIIATCGLDHVPPAWLAQTRPGGKILFNLLGPFVRHTLLLLDVHTEHGPPDGSGESGVRGEHGATGRVLEQTGAFMQRRTDPTRPFDLSVPMTRPDGPETVSTTELDPASLRRDRGWGLFVQTRLPDLLSRQVYLAAPTDPEGAGALGTELSTGDGTSWAQVGDDAGADGTHTVTQIGPRRLWGEIEALHRDWEGAGRPEPSQWTLTVDRSGAITVQLSGNPVTSETVPAADRPDEPFSEGRARTRPTPCP